MSPGASSQGIGNWCVRWVVSRYNRGSFCMPYWSKEMSNSRIHWIRILLGGLLAEVALILAIVPLGSRLVANFLQSSDPPASFSLSFLVAHLWLLPSHIHSLC